MKLALIGATDLTLSIASELESEGILPSAILTLPRKFSISYQSDEVENVRHSDVAGWAKSRGVVCSFYEGYQSAYEFFMHNTCDLAIVAGWYHMIPERVRSCFEMGAFGIHASLLPELKGGAPLNWAILSGLKKTGVTLFKLSDGVDNGPIFGQRSFQINDDDHIVNLVHKAEIASISLVKQLVASYRQVGKVVLSEQQEGGSYSLQRKPEDGLIDWSKSTLSIYRLVRAVSSPYPGAFTYLNGEKLIIQNAFPVDDKVRVFGAVGQILVSPEFEEPLVVTGTGCLAVNSAFDEGGRDLMGLLKNSSHQRLMSVPL